MNLSDYVDVYEAGEIVNRSHSTIQKWVRTGKIQGAVMIGNKWAIPRDVMEDLAEITPSVDETRRLNGRSSAAKVQAKNGRKTPEGRQRYDPAVKLAIDKRQEQQEALLARIRGMGK